LYPNVFIEFSKSMNLYRNFWVTNCLS
jgi:hypothetical protein